MHSVNVESSGITGAAAHAIWMLQGTALQGRSVSVRSGLMATPTHPAGVAGYVSGAQYKMFGGGAWVRNVLFTATLFCGPLLLTFSFLNTVAIAYRSTAALPFGTICIIFVIWALVRTHSAAYHCLYATSTCCATCPASCRCHAHSCSCTTLAGTWPGC